MFLIKLCLKNPPTGGFFYVVQRGRKMPRERRKGDNTVLQYSKIFTIA